LAPGGSGVAAPSRPPPPRVGLAVAAARGTIPFSTTASIKATKDNIMVAIFLNSGGASGASNVGITSAEMAEAATSKVLISPGSITGLAGMVTGGKSRLRSKAAPSSASASVRCRFAKEPPLGLGGKLPEGS
jgi:hypothetical protein